MMICEHALVENNIFFNDRELRVNNDLIDKKYNLHNIKKKIESVRELLNEVTCDIDNKEKSEEILKVSQYMDRLLNEYNVIIGSNKL
ncbi:aspartyl-phosphate phosphatase Spo0E family protein [Clostridium peptidivorans]|uniref:aspartyl-phosphate phosphatase Spo0E family protein n=1 Tax=Clostridium peptidivorans TaxID=100174 RepID=UPI000BE24A34|nr:aspartyl-phosphate phosphatase Spo0E family protein [Clostridium peptidivorans]